MVQVFRPMFEISAGIDSGERAEVVIEVCLVKVAARKCDVRPIDLSLPMNHMQHALEAMDSAEKFRR